MWISANSCRNFILGHTLRDYIEIVQGKTNYSQYEAYAKRQGIVFENKVVKILQEKYGGKTIQKSSNQIKGQPNNEDVLKTIHAMKEGEPIIYQAPLASSKKKIFGTIDLLVRSDKFNLIFESNILLPEQEKPFGKDYIYYGVDIKCSTLVIDKENYLTHNKNQEYYRAQMYIYNSCLEEMQGVFPQDSFILGRKINKKETNSIFKNLGAINWTKDKHKTSQLIKNARIWLSKLNTNHKKWKLFPKPSVKELYPNVLASDCSPEEKEVAHKLKDARLIHGIVNKEYINWEKANFKNFVISPKKEEIVRSILEVNKSNSKKYILDTTKLPKLFRENCMFVDFETVNIHPNSFIYMIGALTYGPEEKNGEWYYHSNYNVWFMNSLTDSEQIRVWKEFSAWKNEKYPQTKLVHWSNFEVTTTKRVIKQYPKENLSGDNWEWVDLMKICQTGPLVFKGMFNFSLKSVAKSMKQLGFLGENTMYNDYCYENGLDWMLSAIEKYETEGNFQDIIRYNQTDCMILHEIVKFIEQNTPLPNLKRKHSNNEKTSKKVHT